MPTLSGHELIAWWTLGGSAVEYEEAYHGQFIIVRTLQHVDGDWTGQAELVVSGQRKPIADGSHKRYPSEEEAREAALSMAVGAIDRARISRGKP